MGLRSSKLGDRFLDFIQTKDGLWQRFGSFGHSGKRIIPPNFCRTVPDRSVVGQCSPESQDRAKCNAEVTVGFLVAAVKAAAAAAAAVVAAAVDAAARLKTSSIFFQE